MTLSRLNIDSIEETAKIAEAAGFSGIGFSRLVPCGSGENLLDSLLTPQEIKTAYEEALALDSPSFEVASGDPLAGVLSGFKPSPESELALSGCSAGFSGVTITSDGSVMPCRRMGIKIGNLGKTSLREDLVDLQSPPAPQAKRKLQGGMREMSPLAILPGLPGRGLRLFKISRRP